MKTSKTLEKYVPILLLIGFLSAGSWLRLWNLGATSFWVDEVNTYYSAKSWNETGKDLFPSGRENGRAQIYTAVTAAGFRLFGMNETTTRLPAAFFGVCSILFSYLMAKKLFDRKVGLLTAFFVAFCHFEVGWSRTARMYTFLQVLTLFLSYAFIKGFEGETISSNHDASSRSVFYRLRMLFRCQGISWPWLLAFGLVLLITFYRVHPLIVFLFAGIFFYLASMTLIGFIFERNRQRFVNKYSVTTLAGLVAGLAVVVLLPGIQSMIQYYLFYTPPWALGESSAQTRTILLDFLMSEQRFPIGVLFVIGTLMLITRKHRLGWLVWCLFTSVLALLTLVFTHRVPTYLFFVYPFFLMVAAFGSVRFLEGEVGLLQKDIRSNKRWIKILFIAAALSVFVLSPWIRITRHIPFLGDGKTNMAVTPEEWREAIKTVLQSYKSGDLAITSLPQVALYYGLRSDYCLNQAALDQAKEEHFPKNRDGRFVDIYAGTACIESLDELRRLADNHKNGWIAITDFHFNNSNYITQQVRDFLLNRFGAPAKTQNGTVLLFHWSGQTEGGR
jgi:4-amino-4-deoxy-L-arabinose transferase-like glycosyltransferase